MQGFLKNSIVYDSSSFITLKKLSNPSLSLNDLIRNSYDESFAHIALFANTMFVVSSFLKNEFNIDAKIISTIEHKKEMSISSNNKINQDTVSVLIIVCIGSVFGFIIYLGGLINEKIKEKKQI